MGMIQESVRKLTTNDIINFLELVNCKVILHPHVPDTQIIELFVKINDSCVFVPMVGRA